MRKRHYKWGRIVAAAAAVTAVAVLTAGAIGHKTEKRELVYTVQEGDTLWNIAEEHLMLNQGKYILEFKYEIEKANPGMKSGMIQPGQKIIIPYEVAIND